ncbi:MAG TPA: methyltransferase domain-containing protein [Blastocatellia bacterium]|nr:methyltransferase domain-containing protein [Blastocatellia bacterium]
MTISKEEARAKAAATYNAASDHYDEPALSFWDRFGRRTVERLSLLPGAHVLDVCSGSGASALPAAERVAPDGYVLAVDLAKGLLDLARAKAGRRGLSNIEFRVGDFEELGLPDNSFDAVICVFGIFFVPDMSRAVGELWRMVRPGGQLAITTWGPNFCEPANTIFWDTVRMERPDLYKGFNPWDRICDSQSVKAMLKEAEVGASDVVAEDGRQTFDSPDDWWTVVLGSGYRGTIEQLDREARERVRQANLSHVRNSQMRAVETNVVYAVARKE